MLESPASAHRRNHVRTFRATNIPAELPRGTTLRHTKTLNRTHNTSNKHTKPFSRGAVTVTAPPDDGSASNGTPSTRSRVAGGYGPPGLRGLSATSEPPEWGLRPLHPLDRTGLRHGPVSTVTSSKDCADLQRRWEIIAVVLRIRTRNARAYAKLLATPQLLI